MKVVIGEDGPGPAVQAYLDGLSRSELHELVLTLAECSETVRRTLEAVADLAGDRRGAAGEDPVRRAAALLSAPKGYEDYESYDFEYGEYTDGVLGVSRTVVFGGLRLRVSGFSARVRPRWGCGSRALSGVACDCRVGLDPRGNIVDGLFSCGAHHVVGAFVLQGGVE